jgi:nucleotide-binding universal stress UspA family protein
MSAPIFVATDFSEYSAKATMMGLRLAAVLDAPLLLVHVVEPVGDPNQADREILAFHEQLLEEGQRKMHLELRRWSGEREAATLIELGHRVPTLLRLIEEHKPAMVVMGSRLRDLHRIGISLEVLLQCPYPVLLVPHHSE